VNMTRPRVIEKRCDAWFVGTAFQRAPSPGELADPLAEALDACDGDIDLEPPEPEFDDPEPSKYDDDDDNFDYDDTDEFPW